MSPFARINLDIGQFLGAGFDAVPFLEEQHPKISVLHIRDGQRGERGKVTWGTGEVPIKDVLQLLSVRNILSSPTSNTITAAPWSH